VYVVGGFLFVIVCVCCWGCQNKRKEKVTVKR
jgi:hypothetical protein